MSGKELVPCPICKQPPNRFFVGWQNIEVIACQKGCKPNWNHTVVHIRSVDIAHDGAWKNLGDAWNTIQLYHDENDDLRVRFDRWPPGHLITYPDGPHLKWSPEISASRTAERAAQQQQGKDGEK